jgi:excisionase family DNA binding protein
MTITPVTKEHQDQPPTLEPLLTLQELSEYTQTPLSTLYSLRWENRGPRGCRIGRSLRFRISDVNDWLDALADKEISW